MQRKIHSTPTLVYPSSDDKPMAETDKHRKLMVDFIQMPEYHFREANDVYVSGNLLMYYEQGTPGNLLLRMYLWFSVSEKKSAAPILHGRKAKSPILYWRRRVQAPISMTSAARSSFTLLFLP